MKKIKKLTLNKEVVSILGWNEMNLVKGGNYSDVGVSCYGGCANGGGGAGTADVMQNTCGCNGYDFTLPKTCPGTCLGITCATCATCVSCASCDTCNNTCNACNTGNAGVNTCVGCTATCGGCLPN